MDGGELITFTHPDLDITKAIRTLNQGDTEMIAAEVQKDLVEDVQRS